MLDEVKNRAVVLAGAIILAAVGRNNFYIMAQERRGIAGRVAAAFAHGHAGRIGVNYSVFTEGKDKTRMTESALRVYSDDSLAGYADEDFTRRADGRPLLGQQRGLIVPLVESAIEKDRPATVLEIGTGNGDILAYLAERHPDVAFTGVDLSVVNAEKKHGQPGSNAKPSFVKGYALELLEAGLSADMIFSSSTFMAFAPKEFEAYLDAMPRVKRLIISDPVTFGHKHTRDPRPYSQHMDVYMWWHNYFGYLTSRGWTVEHYETVNFVYSHNPNAKVILVSAFR